MKKFSPKNIYQYLCKSYQIVQEEGIVKFIKIVESYLKNKTYRIFRNTRVQWYQISLGYKSLADPYKILMVDPQNITHYAYPFEGDYQRWYGRVEEGNWDLNAKLFDHASGDNSEHLDILKLQACNKRVRQNISWEKTGIIDELENRLQENNMKSIDGCKSRRELMELYKKREILYQSLHKDGFSSDISGHCCRIHIGRDGRLIFGSGGRHRFFLSRALEIPEVPVKVLVRHKQWQEFREEINAVDTIDELSKKAKSHLEHPDMQDLVSKLKHRTT